ncbi:MAG TPA: PDZ domain-containing protein, partial [Bryobacteraceae bacterium]|nr:PDZ domain-containing protein [Bryobacteraceae bacterium]
PAWSPDGKSVAYFSDESGEYALHVKSQSGEGEAKKIALYGHAAFYFDPKWSPDSKRIAFTDNELNLWDVEIASGKLTKVDTDNNYELGRNFAWSADSKWIAFVKSLSNRLHAISLYSIDDAKATQVTDGMSDAQHPAFDRDGQYLYFTASTNFGPTISGLDMTSDEHNVDSNVYLMVLANNVASPLAPESDEENSAASNDQSAEGGGRGGRGGRAGGPNSERAANTPPKPVHVDFAGIDQRIIPLPLPARRYTDLVAGRSNSFYLMEPGGDGGRGGRGGGGGGSTLVKYDLKTRKTEQLASGVQSFDLSANGEKMLVRMGAGGGGRGGRGGAADTSPAPGYAIVSANAAVKPGEGVLRMADMEVNIDPPAEWKQMYHEVWRIERSYFYDPNLHGVNAADGEKEYEKYLDGLSSRADLNYIFKELLSDMTVGHLRGGGGAIPEPRRVTGGLLGADYEIANGRYRIKTIYSGEAWNPQVRGPLAQPGMNIAEGNYLLEVDGQDLKGTDDISRLLEGTANHAIKIKVAPDASGSNAREITVTPVASEAQLRHEAWVEANRRRVDKLSGGKLAYVYMPDTGQGGLTQFTRYYFAQTDKQGAIIDERFNGGGQVADYVINVLDRPLMGWWQPRWGAIYRTPAAQIFGPKVMIINEMAGSGGDMMPWMFHHTKTGTLVGKRTWGGLVGVSQYPALMDGGNVTSPSFGFFSPNGKWEIENHGTSPDVEVDQDPKSVHDGHDPQLERAVAVALEEMKSNPVPEPHRPPFPNYQTPTPARATTGGGGN